MMKLLKIFGCFLSIGLALSWFLVNGDPISSQQAEKLMIGMDDKSVREVLGEPSWESQDGDVWKYLATPISWRAYVIEFDQGVVVDKYYDD